MQRYIMKRVFYALISLLILSITIFCLIRLTGDPAVLMVEPGASDAYLPQKGRPVDATSNDSIS